ncbi:3-oxoacyl-[acyl-carrier-protein] synthase III C-terminal domain-containing protein [Micromonospora sp. LOL_024]|uniref:3-oxoacyl-[acyl-carrier-protein] synthase III C-terminal domain-containing protein n=1 Tax=Micromonospora sp. LOL_024 TaxID=3345412 RepID=UPI003A85C911
MQSIYVSSIGYAHGDRRSISDLGDEAAVELTAAQHGLADYRHSDLPPWQLAVQAGERSLATAGGSPDLLLYISENDSDRPDSLARINNRLGLAGIDHLAVSGHGCGNLGPALQVARDALRGGTYRRILLLLADRAVTGSRLMNSGMSIFSDGAAACMVTDGTAAGDDGLRFSVHGISVRTRSGGDAGLGEMDMLSLVELAGGGVADLLQATGQRPEDFRHVVFGNYRIFSQHFLAAATGVPTERLLIGPIAEYGHCFSADILVTLDRYAAQGRVAPGDHLLAAATGPHSWSTLAIEML